MNSPLRRPVTEYRQNTDYGSASNMQYCWGHKCHRRNGGGAKLTRLKLWHCAECVARKTAEKAERAAAKLATEQGASDDHRQD